MGSYDGAELCKFYTTGFTGYNKRVKKEEMGLYSDDGLIVPNKVTSQKEKRY